MKIEKISENQIRCTLTKEDLEHHQIRLSELAYGTDKAKSLFRDMMQQAHRELGFEVDNIPLMIEAIPVSSESIILIITKVEDPEELDTRFSRFSPQHSSEDSSVQFDRADSIIDIFHKIYEARSKGSNANQKPEAEPAREEADSADVNLTRRYSFSHLDDVIGAAHGLNHFYTGTNALYKSKANQEYLLVLHQSNYTPEEFNKVCNILSEYGEGKNFSPAAEAYLQEHSEVVLPSKALQQLAEL